jgi:phage terminase small subunit
MAGVKGRSGGRRDGAGRKPDIAPGVLDAPVAGTVCDAKDFLADVLRGAVVPTKAQLEAAKALLPFQHQRLGELGKKEQREDEAAEVVGMTGNLFAPLTVPRLAASGGKLL